jgi:hypothetical protein
MLQEECWQMEEILLAGVVWEISMLKPTQKRKPVHVEISFGNMQPVLDGISGRLVV